jgi:hypothetical protein
VNPVTTLYFQALDEGPGPILIDHTTEYDYVIHGAYGTAEITPHGHTHVTFTWAQARPPEVVLHFTEPHTGHPVLWSFARELLRTGGGVGDVCVEFDVDDFDVQWVLLRSPSGQVKFRLDRNWVGQLLRATDDIVASAAEWDAVRRELPDHPDDFGQSGCWE